MCCREFMETREGELTYQYIHSVAVETLRPFEGYWLGFED